MRMELFMEENRQSDREFLSGYNLDVKLFEAMGLKVKQIIPVRSVYRIVTDKGFYCLKRLRFPMEDMDFIFSALEHLKGKGFSNAYDIVKQENGDDFISFKGDKYFLTQWIDGRECDFMNPMDLDAAIEVLARLHNASEGFVPAVCPPDRCWYGKWPEYCADRIEEMKQMKAQVLEKPEKSEIDRIYLDYADMCINDGEEAMQILSKTDYKSLSEEAAVKKSFIHHDFAHHNIIHTFDGRIYVVDFDYCIMDIRMHDVGSLILRNMKKSNWDTDKAMDILESYDRRNPVSSTELKVLVPFFLFPQDFWMISRQYYIERKDWDEEDFADKMSTKSEYTLMRKKFIEEFEKRI
ncbi:MAG TPA: CotS family spore coat protein [Bacillota bacterium]|nr:CotS family spore coat protein [Bacillota bacterium]